MKVRIPHCELKWEIPIKEKLPRGSGSGNLSSGGVYVLEKEILNHIPSEGFCDFAYNIFSKLIELSYPIYGYLLKLKDYLLDIGTLDKYHQANEDVKAGKVKFFRMGCLKTANLFLRELKRG